MDIFKKVFGADREVITKNCLILPSDDSELFKDLNIKSVFKGMFYNVMLSDYCSIITLKSRSFAGDCVLLLEDTLCENIILFGSCSGIKVKVGDNLLISKSLNLESFSNFLNIKEIKNFDYYGVSLAGRFKNEDFKTAICATVSSLVLEEKYRSELYNMGIDCVDMESSMVVKAADSINCSTLVVFYVVDEVGVINFYDEYDLQTRQKIKAARRKAADKLSKIIINDLA